MNRVFWCLGVVLLTQAVPAADADWPVYGGDAGRTRYSALAQIHRANVGTLDLAWQFDTGEKATRRRNPRGWGVWYGYTPAHKAFALDAALANNCGCSIPASRAWERIAD